MYDAKYFFTRFFNTFKTYFPKFTKLKEPNEVKYKHVSIVFSVCSTRDNN